MADTTSLGREVQRVVAAVTHWTPARWRLPASDGGDRAEAVILLIQTLADLGAVAENRPPHGVPRPHHDTVLPDQLRVVAADLVKAEPDERLLADAEAAISRTRSVLF